MERFEFISAPHGECSVYFKGRRIFTIRYDSYRDVYDGFPYWIESGDMINFTYWGSTVKSDFDFIKPYRYHTTLEDAKKVIPIIFDNYIDFLTK